MLSNFDPNIRNPDATVIPPTLSHNIPIIGFSATFSRHDGLALGSVFERIVYHRDFLEMIKEQWLIYIILSSVHYLNPQLNRLCNVRFTSVKADINLKEVTVNRASGDFNATSLAHVINTETVNNLVVQSWLDRAGMLREPYLYIQC